MITQRRPPHRVALVALVVLQSTLLGASSVVRASDEPQAAASPLTRERSTVSRVEIDPASLPTGGDKTGVSSQAIAVPQGAGKIEGMGESFSTQMSTGVATFTLPLSLPRARGEAQPGLSLSYSSGVGHGVAGVGWDLGAPYVARQTDRGLPTYDDRAQWHPQQDRFVFNGGQELVPICTVQGASCPGAIAGEVMPAWASGWQYFRSRVEASFLRFFWSPDHATWRVQSKTGESLELGVPLDGSSYTGALERDPASAARVFRWNLVRQYDNAGTPPPAGAASPAPVNVLQYRYETVGATAYLTDVYDTPPATGAAAASAPLAQYAHHARISYEARPDATLSYRRGWRVDQSLRVAGVDVTSAPFAGGGSRRAIRRYRLAYDAGYHVSLLASVQVEGRCDGVEGHAAAEDATSGALPGATGCPTLPPIAFGYQHVAPFRADGSPGVADLAGYEGFDERIISMSQSPSSSIDEALTDLFDINSDALPDVVVTVPGQDGKFPLYLNGAGGVRDAFRPSELGLHGVLGASATTIRLSNDNVAVCDIDGDGTIDWLHQPAPKSYAMYTPRLLADGWTMVGTTVATAKNQDPRLDLGNDTPDINVFDANGDGLVDVVRTTGAQIQTFFALGRYPGGHGNFGSATWAGPSSANLSLQPVSSCLPAVAPGVPVSFSDPSVRLADMNGDGLTDIVHLYQGDIRYWPGRGDGSWGTGPLGVCASGLATGTYIAMASSPQYSDSSGGGLRVDDVNGDGLDDLVQVRFDAVDIWLNVDGAGFTPQRHVIQNVPVVQGALWASKVRLVDVNGSGTRDVLWGEGGRYRYIDLQGGERQWVLTHVDNGLGKTTDIAYASSVQMMLAAEAAGAPWQSTAPMPLHVVKSATERDNLDRVGRPAGQYVTEYVYRDPVYDGRQREFRGFRSASARRWGDANSPTSTTSSQYLLGECADDEPPPAGLATICSSDGAWADNPREALKGLSVVSETSDDSGVYLSTSHPTYTLRKLYAGLDGRAVRVAFASREETWLYDASSFAPASVHVTSPDVVFDSPTATTATASLSTLVERALTGTAHVASASAVDVFGNTTDSFDYGCVDGPACASADGAIHSVTRATLAPGDASGWLWRPAEVYLDGLVAGERRRHAFSSYDANGRVTQTQAELKGTLPLDRFHEIAGATTASNAAPGASSDRVFVTDQRAYDAYGNLVAESGAGGRCRTVEYATDYADLATREHLFAGALGGATCGALAAARGGVDLASSATYDRGLGATADVIDLHGERAHADYDGFGRLAQLTRPSPTTRGATSAVPSVVIDYDLARPDRPYSIAHRRTQDGASEDVASYRDSYEYSDGLGRTLVTIAQADVALDGHAWIAQGLADHDAKGAARRTFLAWFWDGDPRAYPLAGAPSTPYTRQRYDAFGRAIQTYGLDGLIAAQVVHHALSVDVWDAEDLSPGPHAQTYATTRRDGHGRAVASVERAHGPAGIEAREIRTDYLPTGEPYRVTRTRGAGDDVVRWIRYDTLGRKVLNVEPDTSKGFKADPATDPASLKAWRYAYDDSGALVGTSDARGCGSDYYYDAAGRVVAEDYSPCAAGHAAYSKADPATGQGTEVWYGYDAVPAGISGMTGASTFGACTLDPALQLGRLVVVADRGARTITGVDGRGRTSCGARQIARPGAPSDTPDARYATAWFSRTLAYDGADRPVTVTTGAKALVDPASGSSAVHATYSKRGSITRVGSSYGTKDASGWADLVSSVTHDADGLVAQMIYGDAAHTTTAKSYDAKRRLSSVQTYRGTPAIWSQVPAAYSPAPQPNGSPPTAFQLLLEDVDYAYDAVDDPIAIDDWRNPAEWPAGAQPVSRKLQYDDLRRVTRVGYAYPGGTDSWLDPFAAEDRAGVESGDRRRAPPGPHLAFAQRPLWQTFAYDWLGNVTSSGDDAGGFYDRSLGAITNGAAGLPPYQLRAASGGAAPRDGAIATSYDDAGNMVGLTVVRNANAPCASSGAPCTQRYAYEWDEAGRLSRAQRWDGASLGAVTAPLPTAVAAADLRYAYDAGDLRTLETATDARGVQTHSVYALESLELRGAQFDGTSYEDDSATEVVYLFANGTRLARVHYATTSAPTFTSGQLHVLLELPDHLGSSSIVVDRETSEVVERSTYQPFGGPDSDYRPERWESYRDDYRFTGKEEDVEVGLQYFGKRFYAPALGRWMSADPLAIHEIGQADPNVYAYVYGRVAIAVDPSGLDATTPAVAAPSAEPMDGKVMPNGLTYHKDGWQYQSVVGAFLHQLLDGHTMDDSGNALTPDPFANPEVIDAATAELKAHAGRYLAEGVADKVTGGLYSSIKGMPGEIREAREQIDLATRPDQGTGSKVEHWSHAVEHTLTPMLTVLLLAEHAQSSTGGGTKLTRREIAETPEFRARRAELKANPHVCPGCQLKMASQVDHFFPVQQILGQIEDGTMVLEEGRAFLHAENNLIGLCNSCNASKGARIPSLVAGPGYWVPPNGTRQLRLLIKTLAPR